VFCAAPHHRVALEKALEIYESMYGVDGQSRTGKTYGCLLNMAGRDKLLMKMKGKEIWESYLSWDSQREEALMAVKDGESPLTKSEIELKRSQEKRGREDVFKNFVSMALGYTRFEITIIVYKSCINMFVRRIDDIDSAMDIIELSKRYREDFYLPPIHFKHVNRLVDKVKDLFEEGNLEPAKRLNALCEPPAETPLDEVKRMLKTKWVGRNWWGWEALGLDETVRQKIIRQNKKKAKKSKQYWDSKK
jgi:hypothetical protein